jgi:hypothetical protein
LEFGRNEKCAHETQCNYKQTAKISVTAADNSNRY